MLTSHAAVQELAKIAGTRRNPQELVWRRRNLPGAQEPQEPQELAMAAGTLLPSMPNVSMLLGTTLVGAVHVWGGPITLLAHSSSKLSTRKLKMCCFGLF